MEKLTEIEKMILIDLLNKQIKREEDDLKSYDDPVYFDKWGWCKEATEKDIKIYNQLKEKLLDGEE